MSDEGLWLKGINHREKIWKRIKKEVEKGIFSVKVIVYLRRQDEFIYSRWNQQIKSATGVVSPIFVMKWEEMLENLSASIIDYYGILKRIEQYVGKENIIVRQFNRKKFYGRTLYADFLNIVVLTYSDEYTIKKEIENISLTKNNLEIKRIINGLPNLDQPRNKILRSFLYKCSELSSDDKKYSMFSEQETREFLLKCEEGNNKIVEEYLNGEEKLFDDVYKAEEKWNPDNPTMMEDVVRLSGSVAVYLLKENEKLRRQIEEMKGRIKEQNYVTDPQENDSGRLKYKSKRLWSK